MNISEVTTIKDKLDDVMKSARKFGTQTEHLHKVEQSLDENIEAVKQTNVNLKELAAKLHDISDCLSNLVTTGLTEPISAATKKTGSLLDNLNIQILEASEKCNEFIEKIDESQGAIVASIRTDIQSISKNISDLSVQIIQSNNSTISSFKSRLDDFEVVYTEQQKSLTSVTEEKFVVMNQRISDLNTSIDHVSEYISDLKSAVSDLSSDTHKTEQATLTFLSDMKDTLDNTAKDIFSEMQCLRKKQKTTVIMSALISIIIVTAAVILF